MIATIFHYVPWSVWIGGGALFAGAVVLAYLGLLPVAVKLVSAALDVLIEIARDIPWQIYAVALIGLGFLLYGEHEYDLGHDDGVVEQRITDTKVMEAKERAHAEEVAALNAKAKKDDEAHQAALAAIGAKYETTIAALKARRDRDVADALAGALRLSIPAGPAPAGGSVQLPDAATGTAGSDGAARGELPRQVAADLFALADDADQVVEQLHACQAVVADDRSTTPKGTP